MEAVPLLLSLIALAIVSMDLALAIVWNRSARYTWSRTCVVFTATLLGAVVVFALDQYSYLAFSGQAQYVLHYVWEILLTADSAFILGMLPFFASWIIARPMAGYEKALAIILAALYVGDSIAWIIIPMQIFSMLQYAVWMVSVTYCIVIMSQARSSVEDKSVRTMCMTLVIISLAMLPVIILAMVFSHLRELSIPIVSLAYTIAILVFLFIAIARTTGRKEEETPENRELSFAKAMEMYHITEREAEVVKLIKKGLTNKEIASELDISVNTVNNHIANIFAKTEVRSRIDLLNLLQEASW